MDRYVVAYDEMRSICMYVYGYGDAEMCFSMDTLECGLCISMTVRL